MKKAREAGGSGRESHVPYEDEVRERLTPFKSISGRASRAPFPSRAGIPDVPPEQRALDDLVMQVRKLRWMGFKDEANRVQRLLHKRAGVSGGMTESNDTD